MAATFELHHVQQPGRSISTVHRPSTIEDALVALHEDPARRPIAGGTDILLDLQRGGVGSPVELIDLTGIERFTTIEETDHSFVLAGGVRHGQVVSDPRFVQYATPLAQACLEIGSPQLRNRATIAGNLATASPANDTLSALMALGATVELSHWNGESIEVRTVTVEQFFTGFRSTVLNDSELITAIHVPKLSPTARGLWVKLGNRRAQAISVIHAGLVISMEGDTVTEARIALGSVAATVTLVDRDATGLVGQTLTDSVIDAASMAIADHFSPIDDVRATAEYRTDMIRTLMARSLTALAAGVQRDAWPARTPQLATDEQFVGPPTPSISDADTISLIINGTPTTGTGAGSATLLDWIREQAPADASLTGTKEGCAEGECGACTVQLNGAAVMSCIVSAAQADGGTVVTVEGLGSGDQLHPIQQSFIDEFAVQCGFCIPGFLVAGASLLDEVSQPTEDDIRLGLSGNLCRCTGYYPMITAVQLASRQAEER